MSTKSPPRTDDTQMTDDAHSDDVTRSVDQSTIGKKGPGTAENGSHQPENRTSESDSDSSDSEDEGKRSSSSDSGSSSSDSDSSSDSESSDEEEVLDEAEKRRRKPLNELRFRNYKPFHTKLHGLSIPPAPVLEDFEWIDAETREIVQQAHESSDMSQVNLAPRDPTWDLKRDLAPKLEILAARTTKAIVKLGQAEVLKAREAERQ